MSGAPTFRGTRVLVRTLFDYLEAGQSVDRVRSDRPGGDFMTATNVEVDNRGLIRGRIPTKIPKRHDRCKSAAQVFAKESDSPSVLASREPF